jgi:hypothetical protein
LAVPAFELEPPLKPLVFTKDLGNISWRGILIINLVRNCPIRVLSVLQHDQCDFRGFTAHLIARDFFQDFSSDF